MEAKISTSFGIWANDQKSSFSDVGSEFCMMTMKSSRTNNVQRITLGLSRNSFTQKSFTRLKIISNCFGGGAIVSEWMRDF